MKGVPASKKVGNLWSGPRVPNLLFAMYPFSIPTDEHVPLQHFHR